ncbi:MAG: phosphatase PAP2 family protein [Nitrososphaeraceae archaeon]
MNRYFGASVVLLVLFVVVATLVSTKVGLNNATNSPITKADSTIFLYVNNSHNHLLNNWMIWSSKYGRDVFWPIVIILLFVLGGWTGKKTAIVMAISMLVLIPIGIIAKYLFARPRPEIPKVDFLIARDKDFGFPSGEALIVSAGAAVTLALYRDTSRKLAISVLLAIEATLVCISRVYVGGHYPLDVVGGILLGVGVSFIFVGINKHIESLVMPILKILKKP